MSILQFYVTSIVFIIINSIICEDTHSAIHSTDRSPIQYHSQSESGSYNYGYDTGLLGSHQFHHEHKQVNGQLSGRYRYTDPNEKLRTSYYKSGRQGFEIIGSNEVNIVEPRGKSLNIS